MKAGMIGKRYGRLTVLERVGSDKFKQILWKCKCDCGKEIVTTTNRLNMGKVKSCGCLKKEGNNRRHGECHTRLNGIYRQMKQRCLNENSPRYSDYGGRGITICKEWLGKNGFCSFKDWALKNGYAEGLSIDRRDNDGNYCPGNCRCAPLKGQNTNTRRNIFVTANGETHTIAEWSELTGIEYAKLRARIVNLKWSPEKALEMEDDIDE